MRRRLAEVCALVLALSYAFPAGAQAPASLPPNGWYLVAEDDCGVDAEQPHVAKGENYTFSESMVAPPPGGADGGLSGRNIVFDNKEVVLLYGDLVPTASYKVAITYVTERTAQRVQRLEANGLLVHGDLDLPRGEPKTFVFDLPKEACAKDRLELKAIKVKGANAVVSYVSIYSTDKRPLKAFNTGRGLAWMATNAVERDWARQDALRGRPNFMAWDDPEKKAFQEALPAVDQVLARGRRLLVDFAGMDAAPLRKSAEELAALQAERDRLLDNALSADSAPHPKMEDWHKLYVDARWAARRLAFMNPLLPRNGLVFVRRHHAHYGHQCARRLAAATRPGGEICILPELSPEAKPISLTAGHFPDGVFGRPDISFDARRMLFGFGPKRADGVPFSEKTALVDNGYCEKFQVYEMNLDGSGLRKLTGAPLNSPPVCEAFENADPIYLPGGRIAFMSNRAGGLVQCGDWALVYCVYTMASDGSDVRQLTVSKDGEWDPVLMSDGSIMFTRWEYMMKFWSPIQFLWTVRPDGTNPRLLYGNDLRKHPNISGPLNFALARPIPGTNKVVAVGSAHHNTGAGPVCVVDLNYGRDHPAGLERVTRVKYVETNDPITAKAGWYDCPWPLSENYFLVSWSSETAESATTSYGLYLLDTYGGLELIYRDRELSAMFPAPLRPRSVPAVAATAARSDGDQPRLHRKAGHGAFIVTDIAQGLPEEVRGQARYLRVCEAHERKIHTNPYAIQVGPDSGFETKAVLGVVPIEPDGSAYFSAPADKSLFFHVLDKDHLALHVMRSLTNIQPGETTACVGCHEPLGRAPSNRPAMATRRPPSTIQPPPWGATPIGFERHIQPILDKHCITCHDGSKPAAAKFALPDPGVKKSFDLRAGGRRPWMSVPMSASYFTLRKYVKHAGIYAYTLPPLAFGSRASKLTQILLAGHHGVKLDDASWQCLAAWIDCNAPYIDDYAVVAVKK